MVDFFCKATVLLKGILNPYDAEPAIKIGASGIVVSIDGGRNLDTIPETIEAYHELLKEQLKEYPY